MENADAVVTSNETTTTEAGSESSSPSWEEIEAAYAEAHLDEQSDCDGGDVEVAWDFHQASDDDLELEYASWIAERPPATDEFSEEIMALMKVVSTRLDAEITLIAERLIAKAKDSSSQASALIPAHRDYLIKLGCNLGAPCFASVASVSDDTLSVAFGERTILIRLDANTGHAFDAWQGRPLIPVTEEKGDNLFVTGDPLWALAVASHGTASIAIPGCGYTWHTDPPENPSPFDARRVSLDPDLARESTNKSVIHAPEFGGVDALLPHAIKYHVPVIDVYRLENLQGAAAKVGSLREPIPRAYDLTLYRITTMGELFYRYPLFYPANDRLLPHIKRDEIKVEKYTDENGKACQDFSIVAEDIPGAPLARVRRTLIVKAEDGEIIDLNRDSGGGSVIEEMEGVTSSKRDVSWNHHHDDYTVEAWIRMDFTNADRKGVDLSRQCIAAQKGKNSHELQFATPNKGFFGIQKPTGEIVFPAGYIMESTYVTIPEAKQVIPLEDSAKKMSRAGTLEGWCSIMLALLHNANVAALFGFVVSGMLLAFLRNAEAGIVHLVGASGKGKTTIQQFIASMFTAPFKPGQPGAGIDSFRSTENGLESLVSKRNDGALLLDEIGSADAHTNWSGLAYMLANGIGKARMRADGGMRTTKIWRCSILSTGEESFLSKVVASGKAERGGLLFRIIDLLVEIAKFFNDIEVELSQGGHGRYAALCAEYCPDAKNVGDVLNGALKGLTKHHGHIWMRMSEKLLNQDFRNEIVESYDRWFLHFEESYEGTSRVIHRRMKHLASSMTGLELLLRSMSPEVPADEYALITKKASVWLKDYLWKAGLPEEFGSETDQITSKFFECLLSNPHRIFREDAKGQSHTAYWGWVMSNGCVFLTRSGIADICKLLNEDPSRLKAALSALPENLAWESATGRVSKECTMEGTGKDVIRGYRSPVGFASSFANIVEEPLA